MAKKILLGVAVLLAILVVAIMTRPDTFKVERSASIKAAAPVIFALVNDFHQWPKWSPWEKMDPTMKKTYTGPPSGPGSKSSWVGNDKAGEGSMTMEETRAPEYIKIKLEFTKPFEATNTTEFTFKAADSTHTVVTWTMAGANNFASKAISLVANMDEMIGKDFDSGLDNLRQLAEQEGAAAPATPTAAVPQAAQNPAH